MADLTIVNTLMYDGVGLRDGGVLGVGSWGGVVNGKNLAVILTLTVALLVLDDDII